MVILQGHFKRNTVFSFYFPPNPNVEISWVLQHLPDKDRVKENETINYIYAASVFERPKPTRRRIQWLPLLYILINLHISVQFAIVEHCECNWHLSPSCQHVALHRPQLITVNVPFNFTVAHHHITNLFKMNKQYTWLTEFRLWTINAGCARYLAGENIGCKVSYVCDLVRETL